jgi:hypothetical protein
MSRIQDPNCTLHVWESHGNDIAIFLTYGVPIETLRIYLQTIDCPICSKGTHADHEILEHAHKACQSENEVSRSIEEFLNYRYRDSIQHIRRKSVQTIADELSACTQSLDELIGYAWALTTDPEELMRKIGQRLIHAIIVRGAKVTAQQTPMVTLVSTATARHTEVTATLN